MIGNVPVWYVLASTVACLVCGAIGVVLGSALEADRREENDRQIIADKLAQRAMEGSEEWH